MKNWNKGDRFKFSLIGDIDCTAAGKTLCAKLDVFKYPMFMWGERDNLEKYTGERDYNTVKKFAFANLKPRCSPMNVDLCDQKQKDLLKRLTDMPLSDVRGRIAKGNRMIDQAEETYKAETNLVDVEYSKLQDAIEGLQKQNEQLEAKRDGSALEEKERLNEEYAKIQTRGKELRDKQEQLDKEREDTIENVKKSGLGLAKLMLVHRSKTEKDEL